MSAARNGVAKVPHATDEFDLISAYLSAVDPEIVDEFRIEARPEKLACVPKRFSAGRVGARLRSMLPPSRKLWSHQANALDQFDHEKNVLVSTGTGSGKSLVFQLPIVRDLIEGNSTHLVLYPQKALITDQLRRWEDNLRSVGLPTDLVGEIHGDVPDNERGEILRKARILLVTPDILQAWFMRQARSDNIGNYLASLSIIAIDEAHAFEGVLGSNTAFLLRRIRLAAKRATHDPGKEIRFIATSATINDAGAFAEKLTGVPFAVVDESQNGAPSHGAIILHVNAPDVGSEAEAYVASTIEAVQKIPSSPTLLAFMDARQGAERTSRKLNSDRVLPYRSGYEREDRKAIERAMHSGDLDACVSTSALELGIDIAGFNLGLNMGLPQSRKSLRQRIGRVGRHRYGLFVIAAPQNAFSKLGTTLGEHLSEAVEPSNLYLENETIQFQQACCLMEETGGAAQIDQAIQLIDWPEGFDKALGYASPGAECPRGLFRPTKYRGGSPHIYFPLRRISDKQLILRHTNNPDIIIGRIGRDQALREAYPGGTYFHNRSAYRVDQWKSGAFENAILLRPIVTGPPTRPIRVRKVGFSLKSADLIDGRYKVCENGSIAETRIEMSETVAGYAIGGKERMYGDLRKEDSRLTAQNRSFETTGVVLQVSNLQGSEGTKAEQRAQIARALQTILAVEHGIQISELSWAVTGVFRRDDLGPTKLDDAIVIFDEVKGGLRLTAPLYSRFPEILKRLRVGSLKAGEECLLSNDMIDLLETWFASMQEAAPQTQELSVASEIYAPGSVVSARINDHLKLCKLLQHEWVEVHGHKLLMYHYEVSADATALVSASAVEPVGNDWRLLPKSEIQGGVQ